MVVIFGLFEISAPVPATPDKLTHYRMFNGEGASIARPVQSAFRCDDAVGIDYRVLHGVDVQGAAEGME